MKLISFSLTFLIHSFPRSQSNEKLISVGSGTSSAFSKLKTISLLIFLAAMTEAYSEDDPDPKPHLPLPLRAPYYNADLYRLPQRHFRFQDFLWTGSGGGPISDESQDVHGMAWEDDVTSSGLVAVQVTRTMVLYRTVLSTMYPVGMTPFIVTSRIPQLPTLSMTVVLQPTLSLSSEDLSTLVATKTMATTVVEPTVTFPTTPSSSNVGEDSAESLNDKLSSASTDLRYWIQTTIKNKRHGYHPNDLEFQDLLQTRLASVYASAFKRQMLKSLGVIGQQGRQNSSTNANSTKRARRSMRRSDQFDTESGDIGPHYYFLKDGSRIARTAMNVSVSMVNISWTDPDPRIDLKYIVYAEGNPIPGFVAVKELRVITKTEMENQLGYKVVNKAEALVQPLESYEIQKVSSSTPWLIALMALVSLMIIILILTMFMAWKWKHNRLRDRHAGAPSVAEGGEVVPALHQAGIRGQEISGRSGQGRSVHSPASSIFRIGQESEGDVDRRSIPHGSRQTPEHSDHRLVTSDEKSSSSMLINPSEGSSYHSHSPRRLRMKPIGVAKKVSKRRRSRRKSHIDQESTQSPVHHRHRPHKPEVSEDDEVDDSELNPEFSFTGDICRNMDKISFGNLDIYPDSEARTPSAQAKRILSRPSSHEQKRDQQEQQSEGVEGETDGPHRKRGDEQDRELSEKSFDVEDVGSGAETCRKDAEVQTPTRLTRQSPRLRIRTSPRHRPKPKASKMSLLSTESEEAVEFTGLHSSSPGELNPIGRIRKRFHQFLDDAFNVMGNASGRKESPGKCPQSAKVTVTHQLKTKPPGRPWTSHVIREESVRKVRPKSSVLLGPPKSAWAAGSERRCHSAKSRKSAIEEEIGEEFTDDVEACMASTDERQGDLSSRSSSVRADYHRQQMPGPSQPQPFIFPKYPTYPEVEICLENDPNRAGLGTSQSSRSRLHPLDPAVPLIEAIKDEMKRFEQVKISSTKDSFKS